MAELIAAGTTLSAWADFTVAVGSPKTLYIKPASGDGPPPSGVEFEIAHKTAAGAYNTFAVVNASNIANKGCVTGSGNFGARRLPSGVSAGMDVEG